MGYNPLALGRHLGRRIARRKLSAIFLLLLVTFIIPISLYTLLAYIVAGDPRLVPHAIRNARNVLLITAHPDDECLFFSPSLLQSWGKPHVNRHLLVLSSGNYEGIGDERRSEVLQSCATLGIAEERCVVLNRAELQDNPKKWWDEDIVEEVLKTHLKKWNIDLIITFDQWGVSGHLNHRSVSKGVQKYSNENNHSPPAYAVTTKFVLRKYSSLGDLLFTSIPFTFRILEALFLPVPEGYNTIIDKPGGKTPAEPAGGDRYADKALIVSDWSRYMQGREAFKRHDTQYSWDRVLYLVLSRYMWYNDLRRL